jgi:hypothetical protein
VAKAAAYDMEKYSAAVKTAVLRCAARAAVENSGGDSGG